MKKTIIIALLILFASATAAYAVQHVGRKQTVPTTRVVEKRNKDTTDLSPATPADKKVADDAKTSPDAPAQSASPTQTSNSEVAIEIISAQQDTSYNLVVKTRLKGSGWQSCDLLVGSSQNSIHKSANAIYQPEFSTCTGFVVPSSELTPGTNMLKLSASKNDGSVFNAAPKEVTVVKQ